LVVTPVHVILVIGLVELLRYILLLETSNVIKIQ
jgi:hypothetical protein